MKILLSKRKLISLFFAIFIFVTCQSVVYSQSQEQLINNQNPIPTITYDGAQIPSWSEITFSSMPPISESGNFTALGEAISQLGYNPSRTWDSGQTPDQYMMLGDFHDSFKLQNFTLDQISSLSGLSLNMSLNSFEPMKFQTIESLVEAIPSIEDMSVSQVKPIHDLINDELSTNINPKLKIGKILKQSPLLKKLEFKSLELEQYPIDSIPELTSIPIAVLKNWQASTISGIPGLNKIPFNKFPDPVNLVGSTVGLVDIAFGTVEQQITRTVSGSYKQGFSVPCKINCAHVELSGNANIQGKAWISGKYKSNWVKGGKGFLSRVNGGKEPTGRHPFGDVFKVVVWDTDQKEGTASQALFFRVCMRNNFVDLGCTPYFIGPVLFMNYSETDPIFLGLIKDDSDSPSKPIFGDPNIASQQFEKTSVPVSSSLQDSCSRNKSTIRGVDLDTFNRAISIQGNYDFVGNYLCNVRGNCSRLLGTQFNSSDPDVRKIISNKPGSSDFLSRLDAGEAVNASEMLEFFSDSEQQQLAIARTKKLLKTASQKNDPYTGEKITGERLVNHAAQMNFAGEGIPIDAAVVNSLNGESATDYGHKIANQYHQIIESTRRQQATGNRQQERRTTCSLLPAK